MTSRIVTLRQTADPLGPRSSRPHMPGYGILPPEKGSGLLPWKWAEQRLKNSHTYWVATTSVRPHVMPVWGVWMNNAFWFSTGKRSRKARNLKSNPHCAVACERARGQVVLEGAARLNSDRKLWKEFAALYKRKYDFDISAMQAEPVYVVTPEVVFGLSEEDFVGSATRWSFPSRKRSGKA